jgi:hypothetical protein
MITFFFGFNDIGGVQVLFFNLIKELFSKGIRTKLIYFENSWLISELKSYNIEFDLLDFTIINNEEIKRFVKEEDILVTTNFFKELFLFKECNPFFLFWNVFPSSLDYYRKNPLFLRKIFRKKLLKKMLKKNGLIFMDKSGVNFIKKEIGLSMKPIYLPIPVKLLDENIYLSDRKIKNSRIVNITYIGRSVLWKVIPVLKVINDIIDCKLNIQEVEMHIITDDICSFKELMKFSPADLKINFYSGINGDALKEFLIEKSDLHISMGTSCLEGSSLGIPSLLIDPSYYDIPVNYKYRWIFESQDFCLGEFLEDSNNETEGRSFYEILSLFNKRKTDEIISISERCYEYTKKYHNLENVAKNFINSCKNSKLKVTDVLYMDSMYLKMMLEQYIVA